MEWTSTKGLLVIIGGNEDKIKKKLVLQYVADNSHATCIGIIPTASTYGKELGDEYAAIFTKMGIPKTHVIAARYVGDADTPEYHAMVDECDAFFFTGGDQVKLVEVFQKSALMQKIYAKHSAGALIAGTSAGAAAVSDTMLFDGDDAGFKKGSVRTMQGFGLLPNITVDTHFTQRNRLPRLAQILASGANLYAIGVDENTALSIDAAGNAFVVGGEIVTFVAATNIFTSNYSNVPQGGLYSVHGLSTSFLAAGERFDLPTWTRR
ncbi:MAG: cyanophycinase [Candidatus Kapaibacteriota bacterium]